MVDRACLIKVTDIGKILASDRLMSIDWFMNTVLWTELVANAVEEKITVWRKKKLDVIS